MKKNIDQGSQEKLKPRNDDVTCPDRKSFKYIAIRLEKEKDAIATTKLSPQRFCYLGAMTRNELVA